MRVFFWSSRFFSLVVRGLLIIGGRRVGSIILVYGVTMGQGGVSWKCLYLVEENWKEKGLTCIGDLLLC